MPIATWKTSCRKRAKQFDEQPQNPIFAPMKTITTEEIQRFRDETPGVAHRTHLNNAGAALMPQPVIDAMQAMFQLEIEIGGYEAAAAMHEEIEAYYKVLARFVNAEARNMAYNASATDAYNHALSAIPFERGDVILTTNNDYVSNQIAFLQLQKRFGVQLVRAADVPEGGVDVDSVRDLMQKHNPKLVAVTHVPTNSGLVQPVAAIGELCAEHDVLYLVDACQSAGQMPLDVQQIKCDFLSATFRKFMRGPRGAGFLYASDKVLDTGLEPLFMDLHSANWTEPGTYELRKNAKRFELFERHYSLMLGGKASATYALDIGLERIRARVRMLANLCREKLAAVGFQVLDRGTELCGIVTAWKEGKRPGEIKTHLDEAKINATFPRTANALIDFQQKEVTWALRIAPHYYNTKSEIEQMAEELRSLYA